MRLQTVEVFRSSILLRDSSESISNYIRDIHEQNPKTLANAHVSSAQPAPCVAPQPPHNAQQLLHLPNPLIHSLDPLLPSASPSSRWSRASWPVVSVARAVRSCSVEFETTCSIMWERPGQRASPRWRVNLEKGPRPGKGREMQKSQCRHSYNEWYQTKYSRDSPFVTCKIL